MCVRWIDYYLVVNFACNHCVGYYFCIGCFAVCLYTLQQHGKQVVYVLGLFIRWVCFYHDLVGGTNPSKVETKIERQSQLYSKITATTWNS